MRLLRRAHHPSVFVPGEALVARLVEQWVELYASTAEYMLLLGAINRAHAAIPLVIGGRRWPVPEEIPPGLADLRRAAPLLAVQMPRECAGHLLGVGGGVRGAVLEALGVFPEAQHVLSVRRPDLYWFIASCHTRLRRVDPQRIRPALRAAIAEPWGFEVGTRALRDVTWAAQAVQAACAARDRLWSAASPVAALSLRDKALLPASVVGAAWVRRPGVPRPAPAVVRDGGSGGLVGLCT